LWGEVVRGSIRFRHSNYVDRWMTEDDTQAVGEIKAQSGFDYSANWERQGQTSFWWQVEFPQVFVEGLPLEKATWATPRDTERQAALCSMSAYLHRHLHFYKHVR
jgi:hypothetical protein